MSTKALPGTVVKHFVEFLSPGTFVSETTERPIDSWDVEKACDMVPSVNERYNATPYGFRFFTCSRGPKDLDSKVTKRSHMYYLGGKARTLAEVMKDNKPDEEILRSNMRGNKIKRVIVNTNSWRVTFPLNDKDVVLAWPRPAKPKAGRKGSKA